MKGNNKSIVTLHHLLDYDVQKFTSAEIQLKDALEKWVVTASAFKLKKILQKYLEITEAHVQKIDKIVLKENIKFIDVSNRIMKAFIDETEEKINACKDNEVRDACLLASIQTINHYKISMYGTAAAFCKELDIDKIAKLFYTSETVEKEIDQKLNQLAEQEINRKAKSVLLLHA